MRARMINIDGGSDGVDTCGTGGDKSGTFNISTASAITLAAGGVKVAKHGNRSASSKCGSTDVLEALNIPIDVSPEVAKHRLSEDNFVFLFAQKYHPSLKKLAVVRKQIGFPTVFNILGPLLNPASVKRQVIGTFNMENAEMIADIASRLNYEHVVVLVSEDGLDEASLSAPTNIFDIRNSAINQYQVAPEDFDIKPAKKSELIGGTASENADIIRAALSPEGAMLATQRIVVLNAGIAFYVAGFSDSIHDGVKRASEVISSGKAEIKLSELGGKYD